MNNTWRRVLAAASVFALATPWAANAALAELSWGGRFGSGSIIYDRGAADAVDAEGRGSFLDAIVSFHVEGMKLPYGSGGIVLEGTGGFQRARPDSIATSTPVSVVSRSSFNVE